MHIAIDILAAIMLLFFFLSGWRKGFLLSLLGIFRVVLSYGAAYYAGRYMGYWLGETINRPRIVTMPVVALMTFALVSFVFRFTMREIRARHKYREEEDGFQLPWPSGLSGGTINMTGGLFTLVLLFWLCDLFLVGVTSNPIPGADAACFGRFSRKVVYEAINLTISRNGDSAQAASLARVLSDPSKGMVHLETVLASGSVQQLLTDRHLANALLSGDPALIEQNASMQRLFADRDVLDAMRELGLLSGKESRSSLCEELSRFGRNETIQSSIRNLQAKDLLHTDNIFQLIRDPDFDAIVAEIAK